MKAILKAFDLGQRYGSKPNFCAVKDREEREEGGVEWGARKGGREGGGGSGTYTLLLLHKMFS